MVATLLVTSSFVFKHLMARFKTTDIGYKWHEAALPQKIIPYCAREFIKLWYNIRNAWLCSFTLRLYVSRDLRLVHCWSTSSNWSKQMFELFPENTNAYTLQKTANLLDVSKKDLEQVIGLFFMTGLVSNLWNRKSICICCRHEQKHVFEHCCSAALCEQYMEDQALVCFVSWKLSQLVPDDFNLTDLQMVPLKVKFSVTKCDKAIHVKQTT